MTDFTIDLSTAPYTVPCPRCIAFAFGACKSKPRVVTGVSIFGAPQGDFPPDARILPEAHPERHEHWRNHPELRVTAVR